MALVSVDALIDALRGRPLLSSEQFRDLTTKFAPTHKDPQELAKTMIRQRWITVYQAKKILANKIDELIIGQYVLNDKLGEGGMGKVYKALQTSLGRTVALKVVRSNLLKSEIALKRFRREVKSAAALSHPNIVRVFDADQIGDRHFLAMEYIEGSDLAKLVKDRGPLPISVACSYMRQAALGLQHAHDQGMVHRDIKPSNLLVAVGDKGQFGARSPVKILDMGLARMQDDASGDNTSTELTKTGTVVGTPDFMSPEQAKNSSAVDHRSDLYSLGCTFYYLLTAEVPFPNGTPLEKLLQHQMDAPRPLQLVRMDVPPEVATIVQCLLAKKPEQRFQSGAALAHALEPWCNSTGTTLQAAAIVPTAEAADPSSASIDTGANDPFDFRDNDPITPVHTKKHYPSPVNRDTQVDSSSKRKSPWIVIAVAVLAVIVVGLVAVAIISKRKAKEESPGQTQPVETPPRVEVKPKGETKPPKTDPVPPKELERFDKYLPDDTFLILVVDGKNLHESNQAQKHLLQPLAKKLADLRTFTGIDLINQCERLIVAVAGGDDEPSSVVVLQGTQLVTPKLIDLVKASPKAKVESIGEKKQPLIIVPDANDDDKAAHYIFTETSMVICEDRNRANVVIEKRDGSRRTTFSDSTLAFGITHLTERNKERQRFGIFAVAACRSGPLAELMPDLKKLDYAAAGLQFDTFGMRFIAIARESEAGKGHEVQKQIGELLAKKAKSSDPTDERLERLAKLFLAAEPKNVFGKQGIVGYHTIPPSQLEDWLAPFWKPRPEKN